MGRRLHRTVLIAALAATALAACGDDDDTTADATTADATTSTSTAAAPESSTTAAAPAAEEATVAVAETSLGEVLVDAGGRTLYLFTNDAAGPSTCYEACEDNWPPLTVDGEPAAGDGVDGSLLATAPREDGTTQVTYNGHPLYVFAADAAAGDTNGQGVGDVWFAVDATGNAVE